MASADPPVPGSARAAPDGGYVTSEERREYARKWRHRNRLKLRRYYAKYRKAHRAYLRLMGRERARLDRSTRQAYARRPDVRARRRRLAKLNRAHLRRIWKAWASKNRERIRENDRRRRRNPEAKRASDRRWRQRYPHRFTASIARAKAKKPDLYRRHAVASAMARRSRKRAAPVEPVSVERIIARDRGRCHLCGGTVKQRDRTLDHLIPVARGGAFAEWNLMLAHGRCNKRRGTKQILAAESKQAATAYVAARANAQGAAA